MMNRRAYKIPLPPLPLLLLELRTFLVAEKENCKENDGKLTRIGAALKAIEHWESKTERPLSPPFFAEKNTMMVLVTNLKLPFSVLLNLSESDIKRLSVLSPQLIEHQKDPRTGLSIGQVLSTSDEAFKNLNMLSTLISRGTHTYEQVCAFTKDQRETEFEKLMSPTARIPKEFSIFPR